jgi:hypothetical protein
MWTIDRVTFRKAFEEMVQKQVAENRSFMDKVAFFSTDFLLFLLDNSRDFDKTTSRTSRKTRLSM